MNGLRILLTGASGAVGTALLGQLLADPVQHRIDVLMRQPAKLELLRQAICAQADDADAAEKSFRRVTAIAGDVADPSLAENFPGAGDIDIVMHAAADTRFRISEHEQARTNIAGTRHMLECARKFPALRRFVFVSTICVAGNRSGNIAESFESEPPDFLNFYEQSKWQAEQLVRQAGLPSTIARLSIVAGSGRTGNVARQGAFHFALRWMHRGLIPMLPGDNKTRIDLISSELATGALARIALSDRPEPLPLHIAAGDHAAPLGEILDFVIEQFREISPAWRRGHIARPMIVDAETFNLFRQTVVESGDVLFKTVMDAAGSFLPGLLHPKIYQTRVAERCLGGALAVDDWRPLLGRVIRQCIPPGATTIPSPEACHV